MPVELRNEQRALRIDVPHLKGAAEKLLRGVGRPGAALSILITDDRRIAWLHEEWMGEDSPTDVLSFSQRAGNGSPRGGPASQLLGDVVISAETAQRCSPRDPMREILRYLVHGVLHLIGHDHVKSADRLRMDRETARLIGLLRKGSGDDL